jgi:hypothetical protein
MAWTDVIINLNTDNPNVGDITATWNRGLADQFVYSARGNASQIPAFVAAAKAAQAAAATKQTNISAVQSQILTALNS